MWYKDFFFDWNCIKLNKIKIELNDNDKWCEIYFIIGI